MPIAKSGEVFRCPQTFLELHNQTALEHYPKRPRETETCFKIEQKQPHKKANKKRLHAARLDLRLVGLKRQHTCFMRGEC